MSTISEAKLAANRANAQLSTGPTSEAGKAKVRLNAVKTGLTGRTVLLPSDDVAAYEATVARFVDQWQPETEAERSLVQSLADNHWRTQRIPVLEYGIFATGERQFSEEFADEADPEVRRSLIQAKVFLTYQKQLTSLQSQEARLRRQRLQDESELRKLQSDRRYEEARRQLEEPVSSDSDDQERGFEFSVPPRRYFSDDIAQEIKAESARLRAEFDAESARKQTKAA